MGMPLYNLEIFIPLRGVYYVIMIISCQRKEEAIFDAMK